MTKPTMAADSQTWLSESQSIAAVSQGTPRCGLSSAWAWIPHAISRASPRMPPPSPASAGGPRPRRGGLRAGAGRRAVPVALAGTPADLAADTGALIADRDLRRATGADTSRGPAVVRWTDADRTVVEAPAPSPTRRASTPRPHADSHRDARRVLRLRHRYETWVRYVSCPLAPRVDLVPLLPRRQQLEVNPDIWTAADMRAPRPMLYLRGPGRGRAPTCLEPEHRAEELAVFLRRQAITAAPR